MRGPDEQCTCSPQAQPCPACRTWHAQYGSPRRSRRNPDSAPQDAELDALRQRIEDDIVIKRRLENHRKKQGNLAPEEDAELHTILVRLAATRKQRNARLQALRNSEHRMKVAHG